MQARTRVRSLGALVLAGLMSACAAVPRQRGFDEVDALVNTRRGAELAAHRDLRDSPPAEVDLHDPITAEHAVRLALVHNPDIQIAYARLGLSRADVIAASRISNPTLSVKKLRPDAGGRAQIATALVQPFADLLMLPTRKRLARAEFEIAQREIAGELLDLAADVERDWYGYVAARQVSAMRGAVSEAANASAELAQRFYDAGNITPLNLALEKAAAAETRVAAANARADALRARLKLARAMGVSASQAWEASENLPAPVMEEDALEVLGDLARRQRVDLDAAQRELAVREETVGTTRRFRWLGQLDLGVEHEREPDGSRITGPSLDVSVPIFDQGQAAIARAEALRDRARAQLAGLELSLANDVRGASEAIAVNREIVAEYAQALVPLREAVVARTQENVNFMFTGVFELLLAKREEYDTYEKYLESVRDYWLARVTLGRAIGGRLPSDANIGEPAIGVESILNPPPVAGHAGHHMGAMHGHAMPMTSPASPDSKAGHDMSTMPGHDMPMTSPTSPDSKAGHDMSTMPGHSMPMTSPPSDAKAGHDMSTMPETPNPHAGHAMPNAAPAPKASPDPHAGHAMPMATPPSTDTMSPHAGHEMPNATPAQKATPDPHAGHAMPTPTDTMSPHAAHATPNATPKQKTTADPHAGHQAPKASAPAATPNSPAANEDEKEREGTDAEDHEHDHQHPESGEKP